ncbi:MAG: hypothetical protein LBD85_02070 [Oscillospiraceae bacterium]|nr:hypothetical protein [Oscillospiraceae bacterium]
MRDIYARFDNPPARRLSTPKPPIAVYNFAIDGFNFVRSASYSASVFSNVYSGIAGDIFITRVRRGGLHSCVALLAYRCGNAACVTRHQLYSGTYGSSAI